MKQRIIYSLVALLAGVGLFLVGFSFGQKSQSVYLRPDNQAEQALSKVAVLVDTGDNLISYGGIEITPGQSILDVLVMLNQEKALALDYDGPDKSVYGAFIKKIGNKANGSDGQKYWQYWVNGLQPQVAADKYQLQGGETILWTFRKSEF
ncbi:DUF4430 domain-containing protein [Patescibacteria group bacterium]|nr:DUF4430 domain-containing protein [Patescibacteria group bacterium]